MANMARPLIRGCVGFTQVEHQAGKAHFQRRMRARSGVEYQPQVNTCVYFRVVFCWLQHAPPGIDFGQHDSQGATSAQNFEHTGRCRLHQAFGDFLPNPLGHQMLHFTRLHHVLHELLGCRGQIEVRKARGKTRQAQYAYRVFAKCLGAMA